MREGLRAARGHRGLDHNDRPPPIIWNKVGVLTNQHHVLDQPLPGLEVLFQAHPPFHFCFSLGLCLRHTPPRTQNWDRSSPAFRSLLPRARPRSRTPGTRRETRRKLEPSARSAGAEPSARRSRESGSLHGIPLPEGCSGARADRPLPILEAPDSGDPWALGKNQGTRRTPFESSRSQVQTLGSGYWVHEVG